MQCAVCFLLPICDLRCEKAFDSDWAQAHLRRSSCLRMLCHVTRACMRGAPPLVGQLGCPGAWIVPWPFFFVTFRLAGHDKDGLCEVLCDVLVACLYDPRETLLHVPDCKGLRSSSCSLILWSQGLKAGSTVWLRASFVLPTEFVGMSLRG